MKIAIIGYGKMGHMIEEVARNRGHQIVGVIDPRLNEELKIKNEELSLPLIDFESKEFRSADVAIEFTTPATAEENIRKAWTQGVPVVSGSTGWDAASLIEEDKRLHDKTMLVWSSNYSVGVNIFFEVNKFLAQKMAEQPQYTPSIKEIHHIHKLDKPSGTAKTLAEQISAMYEGRMYDVRREVPIESIREGEVPGTHEVTWDSEEDTIVITHIAKGRRGFALGAVLAAEEVTR
ncbi:MAG: 4-hydroxy-tetrahydrodipicolinate reductase [Paludibacteraceae bacterium]|nr:4-hydroxy-tetrahydrodipicolinate reductase [Paludibacteraceae bacterium]